MPQELKFNETMTIQDFKKLLDIEKIEVVSNPKTDKLFMTDGAKVIGAVSKNYKDNPKVSIIEVEGKTFYLLHKGSSTNVVDTY